jgi:hypothetical protein
MSCPAQCFYFNIFDNVRLIKQLIVHCCICLSTVYVCEIFIMFWDMFLSVCFVVFVCFCVLWLVLHPIFILNNGFICSICSGARSPDSCTVTRSVTLSLFHISHIQEHFTGNSVERLFVIGHFHLIFSQGNNL